MREPEMRLDWSWQHHSVVIAGSARFEGDRRATPVTTPDEPDGNPSESPTGSPQRSVGTSKGGLRGPNPYIRTGLLYIYRGTKLSASSPSLQVPSPDVAPWVHITVS